MGSDLHFRRTEGRGLCRGRYPRGRLPLVRPVSLPEKWGCEGWVTPSSEGSDCGRPAPPGNESHVRRQRPALPCLSPPLGRFWQARGKDTVWIGWSPPPYPRTDAAGPPAGLPRNASPVREQTSVERAGPQDWGRDALPAHTEPRLQTQPPAPGVHQDSG